MHYVRFLKSPRLEPAQKGNNVTLTALVTVTTDLGESYLLADTQLKATVWKDDREVASQTVHWTAGLRNLKLQIQLRRDVTKGPGGIVLEVGAPESNANELTTNPSELSEPAILSAWTAPITASPTGSGDSRKYVERRLQLSPTSTLNIWEETGESIARHIWDGGLALSGYISRIAASSKSKNDVTIAGESILPTFDKLLSSGTNSKPCLNALEIGSGCGIVGLTLAKLFPIFTSITLTDLSLAASITSKNLTSALLPSKSPTVAFHTLDWYHPIPASIASQKFDLFLVADCMYNSDTAEALVETLGELLKSSKEAVLVVAHKKRHDSEGRFFEMMEGRLEMVEKGEVRCGEDEYGEEVGIGLYTYRWK